MWNRLFALTSSLVLALLIEGAHSQSVSRTDAPQPEVTISKLSPPVYPRSAHVAHIVGDVDLSLRVRRDGVVDSVLPIGGHVLLQQAAVESARQSRFECVNCGDGAASYTIRYQFRIAPRDPEKACAANETSPPPAELDLSRHQVTVFAWQIWTCDPVAATTYVRARSPKCLYLWRCGRRRVWLQ
jgi:hypothetical protein